MGRTTGRKILVVGTGPLLDPGAKVFSGQCLRTWHFVAPMLEAGHEVRLSTVPIPGTTSDKEIATDWAYRDFSYTRFNTNDGARIRPVIASEISTFAPDALVGINTYSAFLLAGIETQLPLWADLNGWTMAEGQIRAAALGHDRDFGHFWRQEVQVLMRADRISAVSQRQADATYGELAMIGRLDHRNATEELTSVVPNAVYPDFAKLERTTQMHPVLDGKVPADAHVCLWSGGFNSWTDVETLAWALGQAMEVEPRFHFVATGGPIIGHDEITWKKFLDAAARFIPEGRSHLLGWVDYETMLALHGCAHVGLNLDGANIETRFGARNRLTNMLGAGLPVLTTLGTEISEWIERGNHGGTVKIGDRQGLTDLLVDSARNHGTWATRAESARVAACREFAPAHTVAGLLEWLEMPMPANDRIDFTEGDEHYSSTARLRQYLLRRIGDPIPFEAPAPPVSGLQQSPSAPSNTPSTKSSSGVWDILRSLRGKK
jgi:glycosyltransferase involved in cell wall biosynthesis